MSETKQTTPREFAKQLVLRLREAGYDALWAGGCVRDDLLGVAPKDFDVATSATPEQVRDLFGRRRTIPVGASFGVMTVLGPKGAGQIEVATFRTDCGYSDGRHPDRVEYSTPEHDAQRRDFTINGLFYDPIADEIHDYVGGQADLASSLIRAIGDPAARIAEDKLRMLRAVRFAARFAFRIATETSEAIEQHAGEIVQVSGERIGAEMKAMLRHPNRAAALTLLRESLLEPYVFPESESIIDDDWRNMLRVIGQLHEPSFALVLAAVLQSSGRACSSASIASRWKLANRDADRTAWLLSSLPTALSAQSIPWPRLQRVLIDGGASELVALAEAVAGQSDLAVQKCHAKLALPPDELNPPPLLTGSDLIAAGFAPGPRFSTLLEAVRDAQLDGQIANHDEALQLAHTIEN